MIAPAAAQPQQIQLNPIQLLQITGQVLGQLQQWIEKKQGTPDDSHPKHTITARNSIYHTRLLTNLRLQEMLREIADAQKKQQLLELAKKAGAGQKFLDATKLPELDLRLVDTATTERLFAKVKGQEGC
ncbi:MAG: hypothetical protein EBZ48_10710 [Proteobacteria bacterium]|nr:hypothetical protein [Pseudomonadota bacterium]